MNDWTAGYVADVGYTYGYYRELNPLHRCLAFVNAGLAIPDVRYACELGFGQGMSINIHSAGSDVEWFGTDFNPVQAGFAQSLAQLCGSDAHLFDQAFAEFCSRTDLPDFDYIGLHGIWSWISDDNHHVIVDFVRRKLKVGGVFYISYNTLPGWATMVPMRHLLTQHAKTISSPGQGIVSRIDSAIGFVERLLATNPKYSQAHPEVVERIKQLKPHDRHYLAHEYFNRDWLPMPFAEMAEWLAPAKLGYACSAHYLDHIDMVNLTGEQQQFMKEIPDAIFRETVRDFMINQQFRRDYWVKGGRKLSPVEQAEALRQARVVLLQARGDISLKVGGALGEATMQESVYGPILDFLADYRPKAMGQIEEAVKDKGINLNQVLQVVLVLIGKGDVSPAQDEKRASEADAASGKLNVHLIGKARGSGDISYLASPVTGGGIMVNRFEQLFLLAIRQGKKLPAEWAGFVWDIVSGQGQRIVKNGKTLENPEDNLAELAAHAQAFAEKRLPVLKALRIA